MNPVPFLCHQVESLPAKAPFNDRPPAPTMVVAGRRSGIHKRLPAPCLRLAIRRDDSHLPRFSPEGTRGPVNRSGHANITRRVETGERGRVGGAHGENDVGELVEAMFLRVIESRLR